MNVLLHFSVGKNQGCEQTLWAGEQGGLLFSLIIQLRLIKISSSFCRKRSWNTGAKAGVGVALSVRWKPTMREHNTCAAHRKLLKQELQVMDSQLCAQNFPGIRSPSWVLNRLQSRSQNPTWCSHTSSESISVYQEHRHEHRHEHIFFLLPKALALPPVICIQGIGSSPFPHCKEIN